MLKKKIPTKNQKDSSIYSRQTLFFVSIVFFWVSLFLIFSMSALYYTDIITTSKGSPLFHHNKNSETAIEWCSIMAF